MAQQIEAGVVNLESSSVAFNHFFIKFTLQAAAQILVHENYPTVALIIA